MAKKHGRKCPLQGSAGHLFSCEDYDEHQDVAAGRDVTRLIPERWVRLALCVTRPISPDCFHPGKRTPRKDVEAALALCAMCPVSQECLQNAIDYDDP